MFLDTKFNRKVGHCMSQIITYLLVYNQYLLNQIYELTLFIAKYIPLKQWIFDDSKSPSYQKLKIDKLPIIKKFFKLKITIFYLNTIFQNMVSL